MPEEVLDGFLDASRRRWSLVEKQVELVREDKVSIGLWSLGVQNNLGCAAGADGRRIGVARKMARVKMTSVHARPVGDLAIVTASSHSSSPPRTSYSLDGVYGGLEKRRTNASWR